MYFFIENRKKKSLPIKNFLAKIANLESSYVEKVCWCGLHGQVGIVHYKSLQCVYYFDLFQDGSPDSDKSHKAEQHDDMQTESIEEGKK